MLFNINDLATWCDGTWENPPKSNLSGVYTDTREAMPNALYIAIRGTNFDGHVFVTDAIKVNGGASMVDADFVLPFDAPAHLPLLRVKDTKKALADIASCWRKNVNPKIVGITGSAGKTTVKELTAHLLSDVGKTSKTIGNWNNDFGLPKSILSMTPDTEIGVFEIGTNHPGEIEPLAQIMSPDCAIITNIGPSHIEYFGTKANIANEKANLIRIVPADGFVVLDKQSEFFDYLSRQVKCRVISVSLDDKDDCDFSCVSFDGTGSITIKERSGLTYAFPPVLALAGNHQAVNLLQAIATSRAFGASIESIRESLKTFRGMHMRWEQIDKDGILWINDAYNANPLSMSKSLEAFATINSGKKLKVAVLGDMFELGNDAERYHFEIGEKVGKMNLDFFVAVGKNASGKMADGAEHSGMSPNKIIRCADINSAKLALSDILKDDACVLIKASRSMAIERVMEIHK